MESLHVARSHQGAGSNQYWAPSVSEGEDDGWKKEHTSGGWPSGGHQSPGLSGRGREPLSASKSLVLVVVVGAACRSLSSLFSFHIYYPGGLVLAH